jgi:hypothetical protein
VASAAWAATGSNIAASAALMCWLKRVCACLRLLISAMCFFQFGKVVKRMGNIVATKYLTVNANYYQYDLDTRFRSKRVAENAQ